MQAAFKRSEALDTLESYSFTIVLHLALCSFFPHDRSFKHWQAELKAFKTACQRYSKGKKGRKNLTPALVADTLEDLIAFDDDQEKILNVIIGKGLSLPEDTDWSLVKKAIQSFAKDGFTARANKE